MFNETQITIHIIRLVNWRTKIKLTIFSIDLDYYVTICYDVAKKYQYGSFILEQKKMAMN